MKRYCVLLALLFALGAIAKPPAKDQAPSKKLSDESLQVLQFNLMGRATNAAPAAQDQDLLGEMNKAQSFSAPTRLEPMRKPSKWDSIDPFVQGDFEREYLNYARDPATGRISGLKLFSINF
jgi:hypothetical protein